MTAVRNEFDFGAWDVGRFRFKGLQISQMPNGEIVFDMEQYKHELDPIPRRCWESGLVCGSLLSTVGRTAPKTVITDSSRFVEAQQSDPHCEGN